MGSIADRICEALESEIVAGDLAPGTRLEEPALAERFGASRTPVREALRRLGASGLVDLRARRGTQVIDPSVPRIIEMFEVMAELEASCARLAARRADARALSRIEAGLADCAAAVGDTGAYYLANLDFHRAIYRASGNGFLAEQAEALHHRLTPFRRLQLRVPSRPAQSLAEHEAIFEAIAAHDEAEAGTRLRAHIVIQGERFSDFLAQVTAQKTGG